MRLPAEPPTPYVNPDAPPQVRRIKPVIIQAVLSALDAGVRQVDVARAYGLSQTTVRRIHKRATRRDRQTIGYLAELADAEREIREALPPQVAEDLIQTVRLGHVIRRQREVAPR